MKTPPITWKRLLKEGETSHHYGATPQSIPGALTQPQAAPRPLDIQPMFGLAP